MSDRFRCIKSNCPGAALFSCLSAEAGAALDRERMARRYAARQTVLHADTPALALFVVHAGEVRLTREARSGTPTLVGIRGPGSLIGLREVLTETPYQTTVETIQPSILCATPREAFLGALNACPELALRLLQVMASDHLLAEEQLVARTQLDVSARTARLLVTLEANRRGSTPPGEPIHITMNREEMALLVGTTRETLYRALKSFADSGFIESRNGWIRLIDRAELDEIACGARARPGPD